MCESDLHNFLLFTDTFIQITSVGYKNIASGCSNLEHLVVNNCATLRDDCILMLTAKCRNIRSVSFLQTPNITDLSLKALAQHRKLQQIKIEGKFDVIFFIIKCKLMSKEA